MLVKIFYCVTDKCRQKINCLIAQPLNNYTTPNIYFCLSVIVYNGSKENN